MKKLDFLFYLVLIISLVLLLLPSEYKMAVYTPNYLGWFWLVICLPTTLLLFIWLLIKDVRSKNWRVLTNRTSIFILTLFLSIWYWLYMTKKLEDL